MRQLPFAFLWCFTCLSSAAMLGQNAELVIVAGQVHGAIDSPEEYAIFVYTPYLQQQYQNACPYHGAGCYSAAFHHLQTGEVLNHSEYVYSGCKGDMDNNGFLNAADMLMMLGFVSVTADDPLWCPATDFNCDGITNVGDVLDFLVLYGSGCL